MTTKTLYRPADMPKAKAEETLRAAFPGSRLVKLVTKRASAREAAAAGTRPGQRIFAATIRVAEDEGEEVLDLTAESEEPEGESEAPDFGGGPEESGEESESKGGDESEEAPEELTGEDKIIDLLQQLVDAVTGGASLGGPEDDLGTGPEGGDMPPMGGPGDDAQVMPEIGAPVPGEELPPPVEQKRTPAAFARVAGFRPEAKSVTLVRRDVNQSVKTRDLVAEANQMAAPTHRVARVQRNGIADIKGVPVDLKAHDIALVTLVKK
jgi:hypothetical protein